MSNERGREHLFAAIVGFATIVGTFFAVVGPFPDFWKQKKDLPSPEPSSHARPGDNATPFQPRLPKPEMSKREVRVFFHVSEHDARDSQMIAALQKTVRDLRVSGLSIDTPKVRVVEGTPDRVELRCSKRIDCDVAADLSQAIGLAIGAPVVVRDFSAAFGEDPSIRAGNFELWLPTARP